MTTIHYTLTPIAPHAHTFQVQLQVNENHPDGLQLSLPAWIPGSYMIRDFARNIIAIAARDDNGPLALTKLDKQTWHCAGSGCGPLRVEYQVYAWDLSVRGAHLDATHGYFNGTSVFLRVRGHDQEPVHVTLQPPPADMALDWRVATTLPRDGAPPYGFGDYRAADYDELIDHPVEMGRFTLLEFEAGGVPHAMAITGRHQADCARLAADLRRVCETHMALFADTPPMSRYLFQVMAVGDGYGGLEHRSSTSLLCARDDLPSASSPPVVDGAYRSFLGLCSHEYFHSWNVKRIKPAAFMPYRLEREVHTTLLWAFEGITSYYDDLALLRAGLIPSEGYLELLGQTITRVLRGRGRLRQSVADSSFDAWTRFYKQDENAPNAIVSYYAKGALIALCLDLHIRLHSNGQSSLDQVMRALWLRHGKTGVGVEADSLEALFEEVSGLSLAGLFDIFLRSTEELPLDELLQAFGIVLRLRASSGPEDKGGKAADDGNAATLGVRSAVNPLGAQLMNVYDGGAAQEAGLAAGDVIVALDGLRVEHAGLHKRIAARPAGEMVTVHAFRRDELMVFEVRPMPAPNDTCWLELATETSEAIRRRRDAWLLVHP